MPRFACIVKIAIMDRSADRRRGGMGGAGTLTAPYSRLGNAYLLLRLSSEFAIIALNRAKISNAAFEIFTQRTVREQHGRHY
jgi:hypothetical protein